MQLKSLQHALDKEKQLTKREEAQINAFTFQI